jgi:hypothetical protein
VETALEVTRYNIDKGQILAYSLSRATYPIGLDAQADLVGTYSYEGFPPDASKESTTDAGNRAMSRTVKRETYKNVALLGRPSSPAGTAPQSGRAKAT